MVEKIEIKPGVEAAPPIKEVIASKELLNKNKVGLQAALLLDGAMAGGGAKLDTKRLQDVGKNIIENKPFETTTITNGSKFERKDYWEKNYGSITDFGEQKELWIKNTDKFFESYKDNKEAKKILTALGMDKGAEQVYKEYFDEHKGDIGFFASKAANVLSYDQIRDHSDLLLKIGGFYGTDSAEVVRLLAEGARNLKENIGFVPLAEEQFNKGLDKEGMSILNGVHKRSKDWGEYRKKEDEKAKAMSDETNGKTEGEKNTAKEKPKIIIAKDINSELEKIVNLTEQEKGELKDRTIVIPEDINEQLEEFANVKDGKERAGVLIYKNQGKRCLIEELRILGVGDETSVLPDKEKIAVVGEFLRRHKEYNYVHFHTHTASTIEKHGENFGENFSAEDMPTIKDGLKGNKYYTHILATPKKRVVAGIGDPNLVIENYEGYKGSEKGTDVGSSAFENIEKEMTKTPQATKEAVEPDKYADFKNEVRNFLKYDPNVARGGGIELGKKINENPNKQELLGIFIALYEDEISRADDFIKLDWVYRRGMEAVQPVKSPGGDFLGVTGEGNSTTNILFSGIRLEVGVKSSKLMDKNQSFKRDSVFVKELIPKEEIDKLSDDKEIINSLIADKYGQEPEGQYKLGYYEIIKVVEREREVLRSKQRTVQYKDGHLALQLWGEKGARFDLLDEGHKYSVARRNDAIVSTISGVDYYIAYSQHGRSAYVVNMKDTVEQGKLVGIHIDDIEKTPATLHPVEFGKPWEIPGFAVTPDVKQVLLKYKIGLKGMPEYPQVDTTDPFEKYREILRGYYPFE